QNEYIAERDARLAWITGFTGSAGTGVVTLHKAALWTDSRYWTQAERQMDCNWELQKIVWTDAIGDWLGGRAGLGEGLRRTCRGANQAPPSPALWQGYTRVLKDSGRTLVPIEDNLVDLVWGSQRPPPPTSPIYLLPETFTGSTWQEKVSGIRSQMEQFSRSPMAVLLSGLEETAWLFNLRGSDIPYNPVFYSYTLLTTANISALVLPLPSLMGQSCLLPQRLWLSSYWGAGRGGGWPGKGALPGLTRLCCPLQDKLVESSYSPVMTTKAVKNAKEQELLKVTHLCSPPAAPLPVPWPLLAGLPPLGPPASPASFLLSRAQEHCRGPSFETISASGLNAALAHYSPSNVSSRKLSVDELYLSDSGGQYLGGTTDITRTVHWGTPTPFQKEAYTRVLMGNIDLARLVFPSGTSGRMVEAFARRALWEAGLNYGHGTGHGIGNFLSVHEWPVGFQSNNVPLTKGMFTSIEPGYYQEGDFGIRIEDVALVVEAQTKVTGLGLTKGFAAGDRPLPGAGQWLAEGCKAMNACYEAIRRRVGPELQRRQLEEEYAWLQRNTEPFSGGSLVAASLGTLALTTLVSTLLPDR
uniref:X-prolyl aminopeptidase 2 n=1 Tax=Pelodiscus sinensis TaxID=13735 RepID=K7F8H1_PELSI